MPDKQTPLRVELDREELSLMLSRIGIILLVAFTGVVFTSIFPLRLLATDWQLRLTSALINNSLIAILGFILIYLAPAINPTSGRLRQLKSRLASFALLAAMGYLLLIPLQLFAFISELNKLHQQQNVQYRRASARIEQLRTAVRVAGTTEDLQRRLIPIQGPQLSAQDLQTPIAILRSQILRNTTVSEATIRQRLSGLPADRLWFLIMESARLALLAFSFSFAFASGAKIPGKETGVLDSWLIYWSRQRKKLKQLSKKKDKNVSQSDYIRMIRNRDE